MDKKGIRFAELYSKYHEKLVATKEKFVVFDIETENFVVGKDRYNLIKKARKEFGKKDLIVREIKGSDSTVNKLTVLTKGFRDKISPYLKDLAVEDRKIIEDFIEKTVGWK